MSSAGLGQVASSGHVTLSPLPLLDGRWCNCGVKQSAPGRPPSNCCVYKRSPLDYSATPSPMCQSNKTQPGGIANQIERTKAVVMTLLGFPHSLRFD